MRGALTIDYLVGGLRITVGPGSTTPGPAQHIENFIGAARDAGHHVHLYLSTDAPVLRRLGGLREGAASSPSPARRVVGDAVRLAASAANALRVLYWSRASEADVVYERLSVLQFLGRWHRRSHTATLVVESNGIMSRETGADRKALALTGLAERVERAAYRRADVVVAVSPELAEEVVAFAGIDRSRVLVVPNGIEESLCRRPLPPKERVVGFTGAVVEWQGLSQLVDAFAELAAEGLVGGSSGWRMELIGEGPALDDVRRRVADLGLGDCVRFHGRLPRAEALDVVARWSVGYCGHAATSSAVMYHSPLKLYEYLALGARVLSTASDDATRLATQGQPVRLFSDQQSLVQGLSSLLSEPPAADAEMALYRSQLCERHSWGRRVADLIAALAPRSTQAPDDPG